MHKNKKILIVIPTLTFGWGAEKVATQVGDFLSAGNEILYYTFHKDTSMYPHQWKYYSVGHKNGSGLWKVCMMPVNIFLLYRFCKTHNIDVIISHMERANIISIIAKCFLKKIKQISVVHNHKYATQYPYRILIHMFYRFSDTIVAVSQGISDMLVEEFWLKKVQKIYNSFNFEDVLKLSEEKLDPGDEKYFQGKWKIFLNVWRLTQQKWQKQLIQSFSHIVNKKTDARLIIIWDWNLYQDLELEIEKLHLQKNIFLIWKRSNPYRYMKRADVFVFSSFWEWFWLVLLEALILWLPIVSTDCLAWPREIIAPKLAKNKKIKYPYFWEYGILTNTMNSKSDLVNYADAMNLALEFSQNKNSDSEMFHSKNVSLTWNNLIDQWL